MKRIALTLLALCMILTGVLMVPATAATATPQDWEANVGYTPVTRTEDVTYSDDLLIKTTTYTYSTGTVIVKVETLAEVGGAVANERDTTWTVDGVTAYDALYSAGNTGKPHIIKDKGGLVNFANTVNGRGKGHSGSSFYLVADIDMSGVTDWFPIGYKLSSVKYKLTTEDDSAYTELANGSYPNRGSYTTTDLTSFYYYGTFDGLGHSISNLSVTYTTKTISNWGGYSIQLTPSAYGLFGAVNSATSIKNVVMKSCSIEGTTGSDDSYSGTGAIVGRSHNAGFTVSNCYVDADSTVSGKINVGGLVGRSAKVEYCTNAAAVTSASHAGGIGGREVNISYCLNEGTISGTGGRTGGIGGFAPSSVSYCVNKGTVTSTGTVAGVIGRLQGSVNFANYHHIVNYGNVIKTGGGWDFATIAVIRDSTSDTFSGAISEVYNYGYAVHTGTGGNNSIADAIFEDPNDSTAMTVGGLPTGNIDLSGIEDHSLYTMLDVNYQVSNTANDDGSYNVRVNAVVDSLDAYSKVVFHINYNGVVKDVECTSAYTSLQGAGETYTPAEQSGSDLAEYFVAFNLINVPADVTFSVTASVVTNDETPVTYNGTASTNVEMPDYEAPAA